MARNQGEAKGLGALSAALLQAVGAIVIGLSVKVVKTAPPNAKVLGDPQTRLYISPPCIENQTYVRPGPQAAIDFGHLVGFNDIYVEKKILNGYAPDPACARANGFTQSTSLLISVVGIGGSRWTPSGEWRW